MTEKNNINDIDAVKKILEEAVTGVLDAYVTKPAIETINNGFYIQDKIAEIFLLTDTTYEIICEKGIELDTTTSSEKIIYEEWKRRFQLVESFIKSAKESSNEDIVISEDVKKICKIYTAKKHLISYFKREIKWICISLLSASYISSYILMRSCFELLVNLSTKSKRGMKERIYSIDYLMDPEKESLLAIWRHLCKWTHPHKHWEEEVCPIYIDHTPMYHPKLASDCISVLEEITGFFLVMSINVFRIEKTHLLEVAKESHIDIGTFPFLKRLQPKNQPNQTH
jgi:hypothetical protein